ncbi:MAG: immunoglobulin domain-containing protein, partial [Planctomycetota bacterium]
AGATDVNGTAFALDGTDDFIDLGQPDSSPYHFDHGDSFSVAARFRTGTAKLMSLVQFSDGNGSSLISLDLLATGQPRFMVRDSQGVSMEVNGTANLADNQWHLLTGVRDGHNHKLKLYIDGVLAGEVTDTTTGDFRPTSPQHWTGRGSGYFQGSIDEVLIYRWALTPSRTNLSSQLAADESGGWLLRNDGALYRFGYSRGFSGQSYGNYGPTQLAGLSARAVSSSNHSLLIGPDGSLRATGSNGYGQLGTGDTSSRGEFVRIVDGNVTDVAVGYNHTHFLKSDGSLWAMGWNQVGQLGDGTQIDRHSPVKVVDGGVVAVTGGLHHSLFIKNDGSLWGMGSNGDGALGVAGHPQVNPVKIVASGVTAIAGGGFYSLFTKSDGLLWGMGRNNYGQLGDGTTTKRATPVTSWGIPVITAQPAGQTVNAGTSATFRVTATGTGLSYQWRKNGSNLSGATSSTYVLSSAQSGDAGTYSCVVSIGTGSVASNGAALVVNTVFDPIPVITAHPQDQAVTVGANVTLSVTANNATTYQWRRNGANISGANTRTYVMENFQPDDMGTFDVMVMNSSGWVISEWALIFARVPLLGTGWAGSDDFNGNVVDTVRW